MSATDSAKARRFPWITTVLAAVAIALLLALGTWQVQRLAWKEALIETIDSRIASAPKPLAAIEAMHAEGGDVDYQPAQATGRFLHGSERHFFATFQGQSGWYVYTPLELADGRALFVNRGFVPYDRKDAATRAEGQVAGDVVVTGLARNALAAKPSSLLPDNEPANNIYYWKDLGGMASSAGLDAASVLPFFLDAGPAPNPGGYPAGGVTMIEMPNSHLQYAVTWYGLALALTGVFAVWLARWRRARMAGDPASRP
ncbi:MAG: SURF1 family protein [Mesorhizobium sp.]|nr:SURF1 family protein [Mesorhizobium sp.]